MNRRLGKQSAAVGIFFSVLILPLMMSCFPPAWAAEEPYPNRPINMILGYPPGGTMDFFVKLIGDPLSAILGQPILRVHKPGGGGSLGASLTARGKADGYTLFMGASSTVVFAPLVKKMDYTWEDFVPLGVFCKGIIRCFVNADSKYKVLQDLIDDAKKRPGQVRVASYGKMTPAEFVIESLSRQAGIKLAHVPYKSCGEAVTALLGGHVEADFCTAAMGQLEAGAVRMLALADSERSKYMPEVKTFKELGFPVSMVLWASFCAPQKTPKKIVDKLANGIQEVFKRHGKEIEEGLLKVEQVPYFLDLPRSLQEMKRDHETQYEIAKEMGILVK